MHNLVYEAGWSVARCQHENDKGKRIRGLDASKGEQRIICDEKTIGEAFEKSVLTSFEAIVQIQLLNRVIGAMISEVHSNQFFALWKSV